MPERVYWINLQQHLSEQNSSQKMSLRDRGVTEQNLEAHLQLVKRPGISDPE